MNDLTAMRRECQFGVPAADQILFNRYYITGYSYYYRQAKWTLQIVNPPVIDEDQEQEDRPNNFRKDFRIPEMFRAEKADYVGTGYDRGHLVASADQRDDELQISETYLLSNMSPQKPNLNRKIWKNLEKKIRQLDAQEDIYVTYVVTGPIFYFDRPTEILPATDADGVTLPIPHAFYKSILSENDRGKYYMWSFIIPNEGQDQPISAFQVTTKDVERYAGMILWDQLKGEYIDWEKSRVREIW